MLHLLQESSQLARFPKSRKMRWAGHAARMGENSIKNQVGKPEGRNHSEDLNTDGMILEFLSEKEDGMGRCGLDSCGSGKGPVAGPCVHGNETLGSLTDGEFLQKEDSAPCNLVRKWNVKM